MGLLVFGVSCPNKPLQLTPAAILVSRDSTVLQRPPQLNFAFGHLKIDVTGLLPEKVVAWVGLCLGYRALNKPLRS